MYVYIMCIYIYMWRERERGSSQDFVSGCKKTDRMTTYTLIRASVSIKMLPAIDVAPSLTLMSQALVPARSSKEIGFLLILQEMSAHLEKPTDRSWSPQLHVASRGPRQSRR